MIQCFPMAGNTSAQAKAEASPIDILLTAEWPKGMEV